MTEIAVFIISLGLLHAVYRMNKLEKKLNKRVYTASYEVLNPDDKRVVHIHVGNLSIEEVDKFVDDVVKQMKKGKKHD